MEQSDGKGVSRRNFLDYSIRSLGAFITAAVGVPIIGYIVSPVLAKAKKEEWVSLGPVGDFKPGPPLAVEFTAFVRDGWIESSVRRTVWVTTQTGKDFTLFNPHCTHLGCAVYWDANDRKLKSPCHGGVFDPVDGRVLAGPPPRALDTLPVKTEGGSLYCQYVDFRLGVPDKVPV